jgi:hypothetical protein
MKTKLDKNMPDSINSTDTKVTRAHIRVLYYFGAIMTLDSIFIKKDD